MHIIVNCKIYNACNFTKQLIRKPFCFKAFPGPIEYEDDKGTKYYCNTFRPVSQVHTCFQTEH